MIRIVRLALLALIASGAAAKADDNPALNDFGGVGLLQTPTARFAREGTFGGGISSIKPYNQIQIFATPLPWFEAVFRYTDVIDRPFGAESFSGNQSYKDRSFGFKLRLLDESEHRPEVAIGIQDFGGTGVFGGEYLVLSRRWYDFDVSLGLGWGRLGQGGDLRNPLSRLADRFDRDRTGTAGSAAGESGINRLFTGRSVGVFGGVQWRTPVEGLRLQVEYDGNDYSNERGTGTRVKQTVPVNVGFDYAASDSVHLGLGYERGERLSFRMSVRTDLEYGRGPPKTLDPPLPVVQSRDPLSIPAAAPETVDAETARGVAAAAATRLAEQKFTLAAFDLAPAERAATLWIEQQRLRSSPMVVGRTVRAVSGVLPVWVDRITVVGVDSGVETWRIAVNRAEFEKFEQFRGSPEEIRHGADLDPVQPGDPAADVRDLLALPAWSWDTGPGFRQQIGGPDGFYFGQLLWRVTGDYRVTSRLSVGGALALNLLNNFDGIELRSDSLLPRVRSDIVRYLQEGQQGVTRLEANYIWSPAAGIYARLSGGLFEEMYGGVAGELLWRPHFQRWAVGVNANVVQQRDFAVRFNFRDYRVATGHVNVYYDFPWYRLKAKVSLGRYLARDWGSTIEVAREFSSGATIGAFATFTDVPARVFGEGSFDKGFFFSVPFDLIFPRSTRRNVGFLFRPLTRDGGQKVRDGVDLYNATDAGNAGRVIADWADVVR